MESSLLKTKQQSYGGVCVNKFTQIATPPKLQQWMCTFIRCVSVNTTLFSTRMRVSFVPTVRALSRALMVHLHSKNPTECNVVSKG